MGVFGCLLGGILIAFFLILSMGLTLIQKVLSLLGIHLPIDKLFRMYVGSAPNRQGSYSQTHTQSADGTVKASSVTQKKSHYGDDEGEYVEFEEIKE